MGQAGNWASGKGRWRGRGERRLRRRRFPLAPVSRPAPDPTRVDSKLVSCLPQCPCRIPAPNSKSTRTDCRCMYNLVRRTLWTCEQKMNVQSTSFGFTLSTTLSRDRSPWKSWFFLHLTSDLTEYWMLTSSWIAGTHSRPYSAQGPFGEIRPRLGSKCFWVTCFLFCFFRN